MNAEFPPLGSSDAALNIKLPPPTPKTKSSPTRPKHPVESATVSCTPCQSSCWSIWPALQTKPKYWRSGADETTGQAPKRARSQWRWRQSSSRLKSLPAHWSCTWKSPIPLASNFVSWGCFRCYSRLAFPTAGLAADRRAKWWCGGPPTGWWAIPAVPSWLRVRSICECSPPSLRSVPSGFSQLRWWC